MGEAALKSHAAGKKHKNLVKSADRKSTPAMTMQDYFTPKRPESRMAAEERHLVQFERVAASTSSSSDSQTTLDQTVTRNDQLTAEVYWTLYAVEKHLSFKSFEGVGGILQKMFPTCAVAQQFACGETKARYLTTFGLAPYFSELLISQAKSSGGYVLLFDESLNRHLQEKQLDVHVRFWNANQVKTRYLESRFLGHATADHLFSELESCCSILGKSGIRQLSMDGPNVNWAAYDKLARDIQKETGKTLYNIGTCGLHILHNAFKSGYNTTDWDIEHKLNSLYWLFKDSPARREDFSKLTGCTVFPKKFCSHRWLENVMVCKRALEMWPHVVTFVNDCVQRGKCPQIKSFTEVSTCCKDPLFIIQLHIFISFAETVEPLLCQYQTDKPVLPFLGEDLKQMIVKILERFMKVDVIQKITTVTSLFREIVDFNDKKLHKETAQIDCGYVANRELKDLKKKGLVSDRDLLKIRQDTKILLVQFVQKLLEKAPIRYGLVRHLDWLKPSVIVGSKTATAAKESLKKCLDCMVASGNIQAEECQGIINNYSDFLPEATANANFVNFDRNRDRLDTLFFTALSEKNEYKSLWMLVKQLLMLSHGQASVERGFSINKELTTDNMKQKTVTALRIITDHLSIVGGAMNVAVTKKLLASAASARHRYELYLDAQTKAAKQEQLDRKRKGQLEEIEDLKAKKRRLEVTVKDLLRSSEELAEKAEKTQNFNFLTKSNSFRRTAKDKTAEVGDLDALINKKLQDIKDS